MKFSISIHCKLKFSQFQSTIDANLIFFCPTDVALALVTDYDCWHTGEDVTAGAVVEQMKRNVDVATKTIVALLESLDNSKECDSGCTTALGFGIMTPRDKIADDVYEKVKLMVGKYLEK